MSESPKDKPASDDPGPGATPAAPRIGRRLFIFRASAFLSGAGTLAGYATYARAQLVDRDPNDPGISDSDPVDPDVDLGARPRAQGRAPVQGQPVQPQLPPRGQPQA